MTGNEVDDLKALRPETERGWQTRPGLKLLFWLPLLLACTRTGLPAPPRSAPVIVQQSFYLMGTIVEITALAPKEETAKAAAKAALAALQSVDAKMSDYDPESEISTLSKSGFSHPVPLSSETRALLKMARRLSDLSGGAFDVTVGPLVDLWRQAVASQKLPTKEEIAEARSRVGYQQLLLDEESGSAYLTAPHMRLDLGAIAKGYAEDLAADAMRRAGALGGRLNLGGQVLVFGEVPPKVARVSLRDPLAPENALGELLLTGDESLSTTADYERGKLIGETRVSHVVDPRTGSPASTMLAATVLAKEGALADALSTILFLLGEKEGLALLKKEGAEALIVRLDGTLFVTEGLAHRFQKTE